MDLEYKDYDCPVCDSKNNSKIYNSNLDKNELPIIGYDYKNLNQKKNFCLCAMLKLQTCFCVT